MGIVVKLGVNRNLNNLREFQMGLKCKSVTRVWIS